MAEEYNNIFTRGIKEDLIETPISDGKIRFVTDDQELYIETDTERIKITDFIMDLTEAQILALENPVTNKLYVSSDTDVLYYYNEEEWAIFNVGDTLKLGGHPASYFATADHIHENYLTDSSPLAAANLTGTIANGVTAVTQPRTDVSNKVATTAYVDNLGSILTSWDDIVAIPVYLKDVANFRNSVYELMGTQSGPKSIQITTDEGPVENEVADAYVYVDTNNMVKATKDTDNNMFIHMPTKYIGHLSPGSYSGLFMNYNTAVSIDLSRFDAAGVTNMSDMFYGCNALQSINLPTNISSVTNMSHMFYNCTALQSLDLTQFNTSNVTNMSYMFYYCYNIRSWVGLDSWDTSSVTDMSYMFYHVTYAPTLYFNCINVTTMTYMFAGAGNSSTTLDLSHITNTGNVTIMSYMFTSSLFTSINISNLDTKNVRDMDSMFRTCSYLTSIVLPSDGLDPTSLTDLRYMFYGTKQLSGTLKLFKKVTWKPVYMQYAFAGDSSTTSQGMKINYIYLGNIDPTNLYNVCCAWQYCRNLYRIYCNCRTWYNTSKISGTGTGSNGGQVFSWCSNLKGDTMSKYSGSKISYIYAGTYGKSGTSSDGGYFTSY